MNAEATVTRTYRTALRIGEDFITIEETISLPLGATDAQIAQAVDLGVRMYQAQREAVEAQVASVRDAAGAPPHITMRTPDAPASDKQRGYIGTLQDTLGWTSAQLTSYATEQHVDLVSITKGQASTFIDGLKHLADARDTRADDTRERTARAPRPARPGTFDQPRVNGRPVVSAGSITAAPDEDDLPF